ncbi:MAG: LysR family transcriptional regulator [Acidobacteria bacterium]|nr:LysR family transcriptional regulator [Acidobacteriota bacterium]
MTVRLPDLRYLPTFLAVCELGTIRAASARLHRTEPTLSYQLQVLQREVGVPLFDRAGRRLIPNHAGRSFYEYARELMDLYGRVRDEMAGSESIQTAALRVASVSGFGRYVLAPVLAGPAFRRIRTRLSFGTAEEVWEAVEKGDADVGFVFKRAFATRLVFTEVYNEELAFIAPARAKHWAPRRLEDMEHVPFLTYEEGDFVFARWFEWFYGRQPARLQSVHHFDEVEEVVRFVKAGCGVSVVPYDAVRLEVRKGLLVVARPFRRGRCRNTVFSVHRAGSYASPVVDKIIQGLQRN